MSGKREVWGKAAGRDTERPQGEGWIEVPFYGGPKDGASTWYRGMEGYPEQTVRILDAAHDPDPDLPPAQLVHVYEIEPVPGRGERFVYQGTERADQGGGTP